MSQAENHSQHLLDVTKVKIAKLRHIPVLILVSLLRVYSYCISPFLGSHCRFYPSCSQYSIEALKKYGLFKGAMLTTKRLSKCHPWHEGGLDPLPESRGASH